FFSSTPPPPPTPTLFPYTTLFRSAPDNGGGPRRALLEYTGPIRLARDVGNAKSPRGTSALKFAWIQRAIRRPSAARRAPDSRTADRKSTRLNSSHRTISYAVFCLK